VFVANLIQNRLGNEVLFSHKEEENFAVFRKMDGIGDRHTE
jgi:hypothetical protein